MKVSVIIVSYNVKHFLIQCIHSVLKAANDVNIEIIVVDNVSKDGSVEAIKNTFPKVKVIANSENVGFSKANNQGIAIAQGEYILILNPDTVLPEDNLIKSIAFMLSHPKAGALGVRMIDGTGSFLPESKRGLPTPEVAFYKMFGLSSIFKKSKRFGKYHLGFMDEDQDHAVEILSGAYMFFRKEVLDKIGGFDEDFFMYGEDIDLSWRVIKVGYQNYYLANNAIIHYKGESTKRGSVNYVKVFYEAMIIFANKHFAKRGASAFSFMIQLAVVLRALLTLFANFLSSSAIVILDFIVTFLGCWWVTHYWANTVKFAPNYYPEIFLIWVLPIYCLIWIFGVYWSGGYQKPYSLFRVLKGVLYSTLLIIVIYAFLPENWRFSRAIIVLGSFVSLFSFSFGRLLYNIIKHKKISFSDNQSRNWLIVGDSENCSKVIDLIQKTEKVDFHKCENNIDKVHLKAAWLDIDEIIFCNGNVKYKDIIGFIHTHSKKWRFKIYDSNSISLIGSNSKLTAGDHLTENRQYILSNPLTQRKKRILDIFLCAIIPFTFNKKALKNIIPVFVGQKTWIGYLDGNNEQLPKLKSAVYPIKKAFGASEEDISIINKQYAKNQSALLDLKTLWSALRKY